MSESKNQFMQKAIELSLMSLRALGGGPFGAVIVKDGEIIAKGHNQVTLTNDPTAHAEIVAIRQACQVLQTFQLRGAEICVWEQFTGRGWIKFTMPTQKLMLRKLDLTTSCSTMNWSGLLASATCP